MFETVIGNMVAIRAVGHTGNGSGPSDRGCADKGQYWKQGRGKHNNNNNNIMFKTVIGHIVATRAIGHTGSSMQRTTEQRL